MLRGARWVASSKSCLAMSRGPTKFTPHVLKHIVRLVDDGLNAFEIASQVGCTVGSLRVRCSQLGISLRRRRRNEKDKRRPVTAVRHTALIEKLGPAERSSNVRSLSRSRMPPQVRLIISLSEDTFDQLRQRAALQGLSCEVFAVRLLEMIARDNLYDAVIDNG